MAKLKWKSQKELDKLKSLKKKEAAKLTVEERVLALESRIALLENKIRGVV